MLRSHRLKQESCVSKAAQTSPQHGGKQLYNTCQVYNNLHLKMSLFLLTFGADTPQVFITSMSATGTHFHVLEAEMYILLLLCLCDVIVSQNGVEFRGNWLTRKSMKKKKKNSWEVLYIADVTCCPKMSFTQSKFKISSNPPRNPIVKYISEELCRVGTLPQRILLSISMKENCTVTPFK